MAAPDSKYEKLYRAERGALGQPDQATAALLARFDGLGLRILDAGCGQGRDALALARRGHRVVGVDNAPTGVAQMLEDARDEGLAVEGIAGDLRDFEPPGQFDLIVIDRTLHMLKEPARSEVLTRLLGAAAPDAAVLVADEKSNMPAIRSQCERAGFEVIEDQKVLILAARGALARA